MLIGMIALFYNNPGIIVESRFKKTRILCFMILLPILFLLGYNIKSKPD